MGERHHPLTGPSRPIDPRRNLVPRLDMLGVNVDADVVQRLPWLRMRVGVLVVSNVPGALDSRQDELWSFTSSATGSGLYAWSSPSSNTFRHTARGGVRTARRNSHETFGER